MNTAASESSAASNKPHFIVCEGNEAAAIGVGLARPDVVAVYPITPQSSLVEHLSQMIADGRLQADLMNVEGEHAVMCGLQGVALAGGRTFTATCGPGLPSCSSLTFARLACGCRWWRRWSRGIC
jgi:phenylglyoxylate dehydrogenase alpha subunit